MAEAETMTKEHREILRKHRVELEENLQPIKLLSHLTSVLSEEDEDEVKAKTTETDRARCLLGMLPRRGDKAFEVFVRALGKTQRFLARPLAEEGKIELSNTKDGCNEHCMQPEHKELLRSNKEMLKQIKLDKILPLMKMVFDKEDVEDINSNTTGTARLDKFLTILGKKEDEAYNHFVEILKLTDPSIAKFLEKEKNSSDTLEEKGLPMSTEIQNPEDDTEISKVKDKLISFCQEANKNERWKNLAKHFQVPLDGVRNSQNPTYAVLNQLHSKKIGELKEALNYNGMTKSNECLVNDLKRQTDAIDSPAPTQILAPSPMNALVERIQNMSLAEKPIHVKTFGDLTPENQKSLIEVIEAEKKQFNYSFEIPPNGERKKYEIRALTKILRKNKMVNSIIWMKDNLPKGITGPLYDEKINVRDLPYSVRSKLTVELCANDHWKELACCLGLSNVEIQYFDSPRFKNPADEVLKQWETKRNTTVGDLYDILVGLNLPVIADNTL